MENEPILFKIETAQKKPFWFLFDRRIRNITFIILIFVLLIAGPLIMAPGQSSFFLSGIFLIGLIIALPLFFTHKKPYQEFSIDNNGILANSHLYHWAEIQNFHWLGESQSERFGIAEIKNFDPANPYAGTVTQVARIMLKKNRFNLLADYFGYLELEIDSSRMNEFANLLANQSIQKVSFKKQIFGSWRSAILLLLLFSLIFVIIFVPLMFLPK